MKTFVEINTIQRKHRFLKKFRSGFKKLEAVGQELKGVNLMQLRYMAEWGIHNELLLRGQTGYYKITDKGLEWISLADELAETKAFSKLKQIQRMAPKSWRIKKTKKSEVVKKTCENNACRLISSESVSGGKKP